MYRIDVQSFPGKAIGHGGFGRSTTTLLHCEPGADAGKPFADMDWMYGRAVSVSVAAAGR